MHLGHDPRLLRRLVRHRMATLDAPPEGMRWLHLMTAGFALAAFTLWAIGGYHAGFFFVNGAAPWLPEPVWQNITHLGNGAVAVALLLLFARNHPRAVWAGVIAAVIALLLSHGIKHWAYTQRPPAVFEDGAFYLIGRGWPNRGFPSGHTVTAFVFAAIWIAHVRHSLARWALLVAAMVVGGSRVVVGVHWPVDVLAGAALGSLAAWCGIAIARRWQWGLTPVGHRVCVALLAVATLGLFDEINGYPDAMLMSQALAILTLAVASLDYLGPPVRALVRRRSLSRSA